MTPQQIRTVKRLGVALGIFVALVVWLLYTEGAAIVQGGHSTITEVVQLAFAHQPWVFVLLAVVLVAIVAFLAGHFFAAPASHYERLRKGGLLVALASLPWIVGCPPEECRKLRDAAAEVCKAAPDSTSCAVLWHQAESCGKPAPVPTPEPTPEPPVNCLTHPACPAGQHCEQGVGCVADPLPDPEPPPVTCPPGTTPQVLDGKVVGCLPWEEPTPVPAVPDQPAGTTLRMNNKPWGGGKVHESTLIVDGDPNYCREKGWTDGRRACAVAQDGAADRLALELGWLGKVIGKPHACPVWEYSPDKVQVIPCNNDHDALASCDHFGSPGAEDDDKTPEFEGEPKECGDQRNAFGPYAGFSTRPHSGGKGFARACLPDYSHCGPWVPVKL